MIQLIAHLMGDFMLQNDWMAANKRLNTRLGYLACFVHCIFYLIPFALALQLSVVQLLLMGVSHFVIDKWGLAEKWCEFFKVGTRLPDGHWLKIFLRFMVDMAFHLLCNWLIVKFSHSLIFF